MSTAMNTYRNLRRESRGAVTVVTVERPDVLNALNHETLIELERMAAAFRDDPAERALVITGAGEKSFVAGADINELAALDAAGAEAASRFGQRVFDAFERSPKPVIAAVNGYALGGGCELALACHVRLASENAVFGLPEVTLGIIPGYGGTQRLQRLVGLGRALEITLTARRVKADEAERIGLANRVVPQAQLLDEAVRLAETILKAGPLAIAAALDATLSGAALPMEDGLRLERARFGLLAATADMHEGMQAFLAKRPPKFEGH
jgi:enoyl-CoA hydratase